MKNWRSMLFVPAAAPQRWQKAHTRGADAIIVDLEDSTQPEAKAAARAQATEAVKTLHANGATVTVRVNNDPEHLADDLDPAAGRLALDALDRPEQGLAGRDLVGRRRINGFASGLYKRGLLGNFIGLAHLIARMHRIDLKQFLDAKTIEEQRAIFDELRTSEPDFPGSYSAVKRLCLRIQKESPIAPDKVRIPVETAPGEVAQVDFGYVGTLYDPDSGVLRKAWVFVMVLGFSRRLFARIVLDQSTATWLRLHQEAFTYFGGVVRTVVPDNLKAAVLRAAFGADRDELALNKSYRELARHYGVVIDPTAPRTPEHKGKVESGVKYVKNSFFLGSEFADLPDAQSRLQKWVDTVADVRLHGTTRRRPIDLFTESEKESLLPLPLTPYSPTEWRPATVHPDSHIQFHKRLYSVPFTLIGQRVWVRADEHSVCILHNEQPVATHPRKGSGFRSTLSSHLPEGREALRHRGRAFWEERAEKLGPEVLALVRAVFDSDEVLCQLRKVQAIVCSTGQTLGRADAPFVKSRTGFSIGGVAPGTYPLVAWQPYGPEFRGQVTVTGGATSSIQVELGAGLLDTQHLRKDGTPYGRYK